MQATEERRPPGVGEVTLLVGPLLVVGVVEVGGPVDVELRSPEGDAGLEFLEGTQAGWCSQPVHVRNSSEGGQVAGSSTTQRGNEHPLSADGVAEMAMLLTVAVFAGEGDAPAFERAL